MFQLLLAIDSEGDGRLLRRKLAPLLAGPDGLRLAVSQPQGLAVQWDGSAVAAIISTMSFRDQHRAAFRALRDGGFDGPVLIVAKEPSAAFLTELSRAPNAHFLERPYEARDLIGIVSKFVHDRKVQQRFHRRFATQAAAQLNGDSGQARTVLRNLSRGGALLEIQDGPLPERGATVTLTIALRDVRKSYALPAKVVWSSRGGGDRLPSVGVEFTGPGDVRKILVGDVFAKGEDRSA